MLKEYEAKQGDVWVNGGSFESPEQATEEAQKTFEPGRYELFENGKKVGTFWVKERKG